MKKRLSLKERIFKLLKPRPTCEAGCLHDMTSEQMAKRLEVPKPEVDRELSALKGQHEVENWILPSRKRTMWFWRKQP